MSVWLLLIPAFGLFLIGSACSYSKGVRDSVYYPYLTVGISLAGCAIWIVAARRLDDAGRIMLFSMCWDMLMILAYYGLPLVLMGGRFGWQSWMAAGLVLVGMTWFKMSLEK